MPSTAYFPVVPGLSWQTGSPADELTFEQNPLPATLDNLRPTITVFFAILVRAVLKKWSNTFELVKSIMVIWFSRFAMAHHIQLLEQMNASIPKDLNAALVMCEDFELEVFDLDCCPSFVTCQCV